MLCCEADMTSDSQVCSGIFNSAAGGDFKKITLKVSFQAKQG